MTLSRQYSNFWTAINLSSVFKWSVCIHSLISYITSSCPTHSVSLYSQPISNLTHRCPTHSVNLYSQPNHKPHPTAVPHTPSFCIYSLITKLNPQLSHSLRWFVFTAHSRTSPHRCPIHSVSLYSQPNHKLHPTAVPLTPSVCIHNLISILTPQLSHSLRQSLLTAQSQTSPHNCPTHSVRLYSQPNPKPHHKAAPLTPSVFTHSPIPNLTAQLSHSLHRCL
jgi:hypothetical protein